MSAGVLSRLQAGLVALCVIGLATSSFAGTMTREQDAQLAAPCASCHRADGENSAIPVIVGMDEGRMLQRMAEYRLQTRGDQIMHVVASALTPVETAHLAQYFAMQRPMAPRP